MACDLAEFPSELSAPLLSFVAVTGLDIVHNAIHRSIWDLLVSNRQTDRIPIRFLLMEGDHEYPRCKTKRSTYEWHVPKGILNVSWMNKHLNKVPALVVVFYDLDWDEMTWSEKLMELRSRIQIVRSSVEGRNTKVAVVLIQRSTPLPPGEDVVATDRATALCNMCDLPGKLLFVFPHTDHMHGYVLRLENAFFELTQNYYLQQAKQVKSHKEHLNKTTHQLLFVRHQFKMGFYNELKSDISTALRHYKQAYGNLLEVRTSDTNLTEVKTVAGFINFKICKLCFLLNTPLDSISQFRRHIDIFKLRTGPEELIFEHCAWMSKQFSSFGDLFEEAIKLGLSAIQTQHPGFYYQQAAVHAIARRKKCHELCQNAINSKNPLVFNTSSVEFYGQRAWRPGVQAIEPPDLQLEKEGIRALQYKEFTEVNHSSHITQLLNNAIVQFKKYRCPRMKRYLVVQMGEEYFDSKDYKTALTLLSHVIWDYRSERWWSLLTNVLITAHKCAYLVANAQEYVNICLEMLGPHIELSSSEKETVQSNLMSVLSEEGVPKPAFDLKEVVVEPTQELWRRDSAKIKMPSTYSIDINPSTSFVQCRTMFTSKMACVDQLLTLNVYLKVMCPLPIQFYKLSVILSNQNYNDHCILTDAKSIPNGHNGYVTDLLLEPAKIKVIPFSFVPLPSDAGQILKITSVVLQLGDENGRSAVLHWKDFKEDEQPFFQINKTNSLWEPDGFSNIHILPRESHLKLSIDHEPPSLVNEFYPLNITVHNCEPNMIEDLTLSMLSGESLEALMCLDQPILENMSKTFKTTLENLLPGDEVKKVVYVKHNAEGSCSLTAKVDYKLKLEVRGQLLEYDCSSSQELTITVLQPFSIGVRTFSPKMEPFNVVWCEEPFINRIEIKSSSPWPLVLKSSHLKLDNEKMDQVSTHMQDVVLNSGDSACECHYLTFPNVDDGSWTIGTYSLTWKRNSASDSIPAVQSSTVLPSLNVVRVPISLDLDLPTHGWVRTPLTITYKIHNKLTRVQEYDFCMESSDSFMFAGHKQVHFKILPHDKLTLTYNLYPLVSGFVDLPRLRLLTHDAQFDTQLDDIVQKSIPAQIFIMPQSKQCPVITNSH